MADGVYWLVEYERILVHVSKRHSGALVKLDISTRRILALQLVGFIWFVLLILAVIFTPTFVRAISLAFVLVQVPLTIIALPDLVNFWNKFVTCDEDFGDQEVLRKRTKVDRICLYVLKLTVLLAVIGIALQVAAFTLL